MIIFRLAYFISTGRFRGNNRTIAPVHKYNILYKKKK